MCKELRFDSAEGLIQKVAGEHHVDPLEEEEAHLLGRAVETATPAAASPQLGRRPDRGRTI